MPPVLRSNAALPLTNQARSAPGGKPAIFRNVKLKAFFSYSSDDSTGVEL